MKDQALRPKVIRKSTLLGLPLLLLFKQLRHHQSPQLQPLPWSKKLRKKLKRLWNSLPLNIQSGTPWIRKSILLLKMGFSVLLKSFPSPSPSYPKFSAGWVDDGYLYRCEDAMKDQKVHYFLCEGKLCSGWLHISFYDKVIGVTKPHSIHCQPPQDILNRLLKWHLIQNYASKSGTLTKKLWLMPTSTYPPNRSAR